MKTENRLHFSAGAAALAAAAVIFFAAAFHFGARLTQRYSQTIVSFYEDWAGAFKA